MEERKRDTSHQLHGREVIAEPRREVAWLSILCRLGEVLHPRGGPEGADVVTRIVDSWTVETPSAENGIDQ